MQGLDRRRRLRRGYAASGTFLFAWNRYSLLPSPSQYGFGRPVKITVQRRALVIGFERQYLLELALGFGVVAETQVAQREHVMAVDTMALVERFLKNQEGGQRHREIVHDHRVVQVLLTVIDQLL